jgi:hypothetical protein
LVFCFLLCLAGWYAAASTEETGNGFDTLPLFSYLVWVLCPLLSVCCFIAMPVVKVGSAWWLVLGVLLLIPQIFIWFVVMDAVLAYLGILRHGFFGHF